MIEILQYNQHGKQESLRDMFKLRKKIFKDRMGWDVDITNEGLEIDNYDLPETVYILARDDDGRAVGIWRLLPSSSPSMVKEIWPQFTSSFPMPVSPQIWEISRFGVLVSRKGEHEYMHSVNKTTAEMIVALLKLSLMSNISHVYTMYNLQVGRSVRRIGFNVEETSDVHLIEGNKSVVGKITLDQKKLDHVRALTGVDVPLGYEDLPPILQNWANGRHSAQSAHYFEKISA